MSTLTAELPDLIATALAEGASVADVEYDLLEPAGLPLEEHDALWLYALARAECPRPRTVTVIGN
jgi:hypothetical protein